MLSICTHARSQSLYRWQNLLRQYLDTAVILAVGFHSRVESFTSYFLALEYLQFEAKFMIFRILNFPIKQ